jgi:hypothetical protein
MLVGILFCPSRQGTFCLLLLQFSDADPFSMVLTQLRLSNDVVAEYLFMFSTGADAMMGVTLMKCTFLNLAS